MIRIDGYLIDVAESEDINLQADVTSYPVEQGADVADHVIARPLEIRVSGVVSDTPLGDVARERNSFDVIGGEAFALPSDEARARLKAIYDAREPVTIILTRGTFENMVCSEFSEHRDAQTGAALRFQATFVQVQIVVNERAIVRVSVPRAAAKRDLGHLTPKEKRSIDHALDELEEKGQVELSQEQTSAFAKDYRSRRPDLFDSAGHYVGASG